MKICQIVPSLEARHGGPSKSVHCLATSLARLGHQVDLLATQPDTGTALETETSLRVMRFGRDRPAFLCASAGLREHLRQHSYDCVHHHALWLRTLHYARRAAQASGSRLVISPRGMMGDWSWQHHRWRKWLAARWIHPGALRGAAGWHATSAAEAGDIRRRGFAQPVCVAPNGVAAPTPDEVTHAHEAWCELVPAVTTRPVALFYSRFHRKKRVLELIDLWIASAPKAWLLLVAGIPQGFTVAGLAAHVAVRSAGERVAVVDGRDRPPPYGAASLFLLPSHEENFGLVVAEAMAWGLPVVVTDTMPWADVAREEVGWSVPWSRYGEALGQALMEAPERLEQRGARARDWVLARYSWEHAARELAAFYEQLRTGTG